MQHQKARGFASTSKNETSVYAKSHTTTNIEEMLIAIDFDNVEDILDFSAHSSPQTAANSPHFSANNTQSLPTIANTPCSSAKLNSTYSLPKIANNPCSSANSTYFLPETANTPCSSVDRMHSSPSTLNNSRSLPKAANIKSIKQHIPRLHRMVAEDEVKLLELKPIIDNFVNDQWVIPEDEETDHETGPKNKRRFQCIFCGSKFIRSTHLQRHLRLHTGAKPYFCPICRKRFSRSDYKSAHVHSHRTEKVHCCCVCGKIYLDLTRFANHCQTHDDREYIRIAMSRTAEENEAHLAKQVQIADDPILATTIAEQIEMSSCVTIEKIDNSTAEECIVCIENPIYKLNYQPFSVRSSAFPFLHVIS